MTDLSKRLRKMAERDDRRDLLGVIPGILREAADALDARWQTMESAPRDGVKCGPWILACRQKEYAATPASNWEARVTQWVWDDGMEEHGFWAVSAGGGWNPTHWHPLPPPPE
jgi:hypothetical protein